jgi:hypothetical protein
MVFYFCSAVFFKPLNGFLAQHFLILTNAMKERQRIITVIIVVVGYNLINKYFISHRGLTLSSVIISIVIAFVVYLALIYFFGKKHMN